MLYPAPRYLDVGETALSVEFGDSVAPQINRLVLALDARLRAAPPDGLAETAPTYRALILHYEPLALPRSALVAHVEALLTGLDAAPDAPKNRWRVPCCYDATCGEDLAVAGAALGLAPEKVAALHSGAEYRAYMYGFAPGWCYLGGLPKELAAPRRASPRGPTPPGAVLIGGGLSLIGTNPMPTGWYVLGRTPERLIALDRDPPFLVEPGDALRFEPVDAATFAALDARAAAGEIVLRRETP